MNNSQLHINEMLSTIPYIKDDISFKNTENFLSFGIGFNFGL